MNWKSGIWVEYRHGTRNNTYNIAYIISYNGWETFGGDKFDTITLSIVVGEYVGGIMEHDKYMSDEYWSEIRVPPYGERWAMKAVFT